MLPAQNKAWWKEAVVYQIYPASFADSDGDGIGDLEGIRSHLDYIQDLGATMIWLCPHMESPNVDMGYDISNYERIQPVYGDMNKMQALMDDIHKRGMKIMFDLVVNHTSDKHAFFQESRRDKDNAKADWYIWRDGKMGSDGKRQEPNNWASIWGGSAWQWEECRGQYYLHLFSPQQPDLNWDNAEVRTEVFDIVNRWQSRGVDGWRLDAINFISKPQSPDPSQDFPDAPVTDPPSCFQPAFPLFNTGKRVHDYLKELYANCLKPDVMTVGEAVFTTPEQTTDYCAWTRDDRELQMVFSFDHLDIYGTMEGGPLGRLDHNAFMGAIERWQKASLKHDSWNSVCLANHDQPRPINQVLRGAAPQHRVRSAKLLALLDCCLTGTLFIYQGEEIGMVNVPEDWPIEEYVDLVSQKYYKDEMERRKRLPDVSETDMSDVMRGINRKARDNARVPMPWDDSVHAGFTTGVPWMRMNDDKDACNVMLQESDSNSALAFCKRCIALRKATPALNYGTFEMVTLEEDEAVQAFQKTMDGGNTHVYVANFEPREVKVDLSKLKDTRELVISNMESKTDQILAPFEARLYALDSPVV